MEGRRSRERLDSTSARWLPAIVREGRRGEGGRGQGREGGRERVKDLCAVLCCAVLCLKESVQFLHERAGVHTCMRFAKNPGEPLI